MGNNILTKELLLKSVEGWNAAREENPDLKPNLYGADLHGVDLCGVNFMGADLCGTDLSNADLSGANLGGASFYLTSLDGANLSGAYLGGAAYYWESLDGANLSYVVVGPTTFSAVDLSNVIGLETINHRGPSTIGIDTIYASNGEIPDVFMRGCGLPDVAIKKIREMNPKASDYYSCFISHSSLDKIFVDRLYDELQEKGVRCYYAPHDLPIGAKTRLTIHEKIRNYDKLLLVLSEHSVKSGWVEDEVEHAFDLEKERGMPVLFPIRLDTVVMASKTGWASSVKNQRNIGDFTEWNEDVAYKAAFNRLLRDLKK